MSDEYDGFFGEEVAADYDAAGRMFDPVVVAPVVELHRGIRPCLTP